MVNQANNWKYKLKVRLEVLFETHKPDIRRYLVPTDRGVTRKRSQAEIISLDPTQLDDNDATTIHLPNAGPTKRKKVYRTGQSIKASRKRGEEIAEMDDRFVCKTGGDVSNVSCPKSLGFVVISQRLI